MGISSVLGTGALVPAGYGFRNLVINGAMQVAQRGTSASSKTTSGYYTADRFLFGVSSLGTWTQSVENDAPTGSGFRKSLKMLCTTADASPASSDYAAIITRLEGQNLQSVKKGTSSAERLTLTFWVKSNVTGTHIVNFYDYDNNREVSASYSVSASATWEKKTIVIPADTTGAFDNDNATSLEIGFYLGAGSNFTGGSLNTVWSSASASNRIVGQTNVAAATNNYWQITGVQLEVGPVATAFEFKPFDVELAQCQRYFSSNFPVNTAPSNGQSILNSELPYFHAFATNSVRTSWIRFPVTMRVEPHTFAFYRTDYTGTDGRWGIYQGSWLDTSSTNAATEANSHGFQVDTTATATAHNSYIAAGYWTADAEL